MVLPTPPQCIRSQPLGFPIFQQFLTLRQPPMNSLYNDLSFSYRTLWLWITLSNLQETIHRNTKAERILGARRRLQEGQNRETLPQSKLSHHKQHSTHRHQEWQIKTGLPTLAPNMEHWLVSHLCQATVFRPCKRYQINKISTLTKIWRQSVDMVKTDAKIVLCYSQEACRLLNANHARLRPSQKLSTLNQWQKTKKQG